MDFGISLPLFHCGTDSLIRSLFNQALKNNKKGISPSQTTSLSLLIVHQNKIKNSQLCLSRELGQNDFALGYTGENDE